MMLLQQDDNTPTAMGTAIKVFTNFFPGSTLVAAASTQTVRMWAMIPAPGSAWSLTVVLLNKGSAPVDQQVIPTPRLRLLPLSLSSPRLSLFLPPSLFMYAHSHTAVSICATIQDLPGCQLTGDMSQTAPCLGIRMRPATHTATS